jgi:cysteine synthase A
MPQQFENPSNPAIHHDATAQEILRDFPDGVDFLITGVGTGGHITGVSEALKERFPSLQTFAVEPAKSAVISGGEPSPHRLQGIGAGFVPANLHTDTLDGVIQVSEDDGYAYAVRSASEEGIFVGPASGAALAAVAQKLPDIPDGSTVLTFCYDTGERYFSVEGLFDSDGTAVQIASTRSERLTSPRTRAPRAAASASPSGHQCRRPCRTRSSDPSGRSRGGRPAEPGTR